MCWVKAVLQGVLPPVHQARDVDYSFEKEESGQLVAEDRSRILKAGTSLQINLGRSFYLDVSEQCLDGS